MALGSAARGPGQEEGGRRGPEPGLQAGPAVAPSRRARWRRSVRDRLPGGEWPGAHEGASGLGHMGGRVAWGTWGGEWPGAHVGASGLGHMGASGLGHMRGRVAWGPSWGLCLLAPQQAVGQAGLGAWVGQGSLRESGRLVAWASLCSLSPPCVQFWVSQGSTGAGLPRVAGQECGHHHGTTRWEQATAAVAARLKRLQRDARHAGEGALRAAATRERIEEVGGRRCLVPRFTELGPAHAKCHRGGGRG